MSRTTRIEIYDDWVDIFLNNARIYSGHHPHINDFARILREQFDCDVEVIFVEPDDDDD